MSRSVWDHVKKRPNGTAAAEDDEESGLLLSRGPPQPHQPTEEPFSGGLRRTVLSPLTRNKKDDDLERIDSVMDTSSHSVSSSNNEADSVVSTGSLKPSRPRLQSSTKAWQLFIGAVGIYSAYLYYGNVQEDLFRYRNASGLGFASVWFLQVMESAVTAAIGFAGRRRSGCYHNNKRWPVLSFWKSGVSQLAAKALMSMSLAAGLSFPVVVLAKSAKIVPVMLGQILMGGSNYTVRDYLFALLIVIGTSMLSFGSDDRRPDDAGRDTASGLLLIVLSLGADGFTGGLQKKLKKETADLHPTAFDFLYFSHCAQLAVALIVCVLTGELWSAPVFLRANPSVWWLVTASCLCSAIGQCFIFYVIACFDPLVCTTITTTRKILSVVLSIGFKGHDISTHGAVGLMLACSALLVEIEGKVHQYRRGNSNASKEDKTKSTTATTS